MALQMVTNGGNTESLFRGAFLESGSALPFGSVTEEQGLYNSLVAATNCSDAVSTLQCLREVPYTQLQNAIVSTGPSFPQVCLVRSLQA